MKKQLAARKSFYKLCLTCFQGVTGFFLLGIAGEILAADTSELQVSAETLMSDYQSNEIAADGKYKDKIIKVNGIVDEIGKDILGEPYVTLKTNENPLRVQCIFDDSFEEKLAGLSKDQELTMEGRVSGKLGIIILRDCSF